MKNQEHSSFKELLKEIEEFENIGDSRVKTFAFMSLKSEILRVKIFVEEQSHGITNQIESS